MRRHSSPDQTTCFSSILHHDELPKRTEFAPRQMTVMPPTNLLLLLSVLVPLPHPSVSFMNFSRCSFQTAALVWVP